MNKKNRHVKKGLALGIIVLLVVGGTITSTGSKPKDGCKLASYNFFSDDKGTEYWALIFAVGKYKDNPDEDRPLMEKAAENLYEVLVTSPNSKWKADHIHKVIGEKATGRRLIRELIWLIRSEDSDDMSLIYLTTHGSPLKGPNGNPLDLPPRDENDGADEVLIMYEGFVKWYAFIWDDLLNFFLNLLQSKGVCLIVESCYAGGFNDEPKLNEQKVNDYTVESYIQGLSDELSSQNRVVLMSCTEDELSYGCRFSEFLIYGFWGWADFLGNRNGINSAEEAFDYAKLFINHEQHPTILDRYPGEFPVTYS
jgi:hypothetical protein